MKIRKTNKLFYKKYPYKVECRLKGAEFVKRFSVDELQSMCNSKLKSPLSYRELTDGQKDKLIEFALGISKFLEMDYQVRAEYNTLNFYLETQDEYNQICTDLKEWIASVTEPESADDLEKLFSKNHRVICNKLPHDMYEYKIILKNDMSVEQREKFWNWTKNYGDAYRIYGNTERWMRDQRGWCFDPFMYVKNGQYLTMLHLYLGNMVRRTHEFVLRDTAINTVSEDELCQP